MDSYDYMSPEAIEATLAANTREQNAKDSDEPRNYDIGFNEPDLSNLLALLKFVYDSGDDTGLGEWAGDFASSISETLGVEMV